MPPGSSGGPAGDCTHDLCVSIDALWETSEGLPLLPDLLSYLLNADAAGTSMRRLLPGTLCSYAAASAAAREAAGFCTPAAAAEAAGAGTSDTGEEAAAEAPLSMLASSSDVRSMICGTTSPVGCDLSADTRPRPSGRTGCGAGGTGAAGAWSAASCCAGAADAPPAAGLPAAGMDALGQGDAEEAGRDSLAEGLLADHRWMACNHPQAKDPHAKCLLYVIRMQNPCDILGHKCNTQASTKMGTREQAALASSRHFLVMVLNTFRFMRLIRKSREGGREEERHAANPV